VEHIRTLEAAMHGSFDKSGENDSRTHRSWSVGLFALPVFVVIALVGLMLTQPAASNWISEAAQAEFVGLNPAPQAAPTQLAQPAMVIRIVKATD
jgi:hypothetical protein